MQSLVRRFLEPSIVASILGDIGIWWRAMSGVDDRLDVQLGDGSCPGRAAAEQRATAPDFPAPHVRGDGVNRCLVHGCIPPFAPEPFPFHESWSQPYLVCNRSPTSAN